MTQQFYRFDPVCDRDGHPTRVHWRFEDQHDFALHPKLLEQLDLASCPETTPEGRALWVYLRLCQVLKYDEGNFYHAFRNNPNDNVYDSLAVVGDVTAETPVTCFNFSRIAVKLLNQIPGVTALMIALGKNVGHLRFGYYTDKVSVDAEPTTARNHFNDLARVKLGIEPQGLRIFNGYEIMNPLMRRVAPPMLAKAQRGLHEYLQVLADLPPVEKHTQIDMRHLVAALKEQGVDGATLVQLLLDMNRQCDQPPYQIARAGYTDLGGTVKPQLLVRAARQLCQIDLDTLAVEDLSWEAYYHATRGCRLVFSQYDGREQDRFEEGLTFAAGKLHPDERGLEQ